MISWTPQWGVHCLLAGGLDDRTDPPQLRGGQSKFLERVPHGRTDPP